MRGAGARRCRTAQRIRAPAARRAASRAVRRRVRGLRGAPRSDPTPHPRTRHRRHRAPRRPGDGWRPLDELLRATPECAYLLATTPDTRAPSDDSHLEEVFLGGLGRAECLELLETGTGRPLTEEETAWAGDLRFASEGLPLRFVQAAALLRQRDERNLAASDDEDDEPGVFEERQRNAAFTPLPTLAEGAAPAELLASRVSESARAALRIACALGGELPHHAHLPALVGDTHADAAVAELLGCGLLTPVGTRYRLAAGVARQLEEAGFGDTEAEEARTAARHYAWWTGHASVTPERVAAEADAVLAALAGADVVAAVLLARTAAPAFAASRHWEAWERVLRSGAEAARKAGEVAEQAYFHHELGVLALCEGRLDRARAELEASIGLRGALADKRGTVAGRRALALVTDREKAGVEVSPPLRLEAPVAAADAVTAVVPAVAATAKTPALPALPAFPALPAAPAASAAPTTPMAPVVPVIGRPTAAPTTLSEVFEDAFPLDPKPTVAAAPAAPSAPPAPRARTLRKPVVLAAAGALAAVVLGTVVGLALTGSDDAETPAGGTGGPAASSTPTPGQGVPNTSGNDPAPDPGTPAPDASEPVAPEAGSSPDPNQPSRTPSRKPQTPATRTPATTNPKPPTSDPDPDPTPPRRLRLRPLLRLRPPRRRRRRARSAARRPRSHGSRGPDRTRAPGRGAGPGHGDAPKAGGPGSGRRSRRRGAGSRQNRRSLSSSIPRRAL